MRRPARILGVLRIAAVLCSPLLVLDTALPGRVLCHRADGRTVIETDAGPGACGCEECEECLTARRAPAAVPETAAAWKSCHCRHETVFSESGASGGPVPTKRIKTAPGEVFSAAPPTPDASAAAGRRGAPFDFRFEDPSESRAPRTLRL
jgi:hypothetical protein